MSSYLIGLAVLLAVGFMIFRPRQSRHSSGVHGHHESDQEADARGGSRPAADTKRGGGCCG